MTNLTDNSGVNITSITEVNMEIVEASKKPVPSYLNERSLKLDAAVLVILDYSKASLIGSMLDGEFFPSGNLDLLKAVEADSVVHDLYNPFHTKPTGAGIAVELFKETLAAADVVTTSNHVYIGDPTDIKDHLDRQRIRMEHATDVHSFWDIPDDAFSPLVSTDSNGDHEQPICLTDFIQTDFYKSVVPGKIQDVQGFNFVIHVTAPKMYEKPLTYIKGIIQKLGKLKGESHTPVYLGVVLNTPDLKSPDTLDLVQRLLSPNPEEDQLLKKKGKKTTITTTLDFEVYSAASLPEGASWVPDEYADVTKITDEGDLLLIKKL